MLSHPADYFACPQNFLKSLQSSRGKNGPGFFRFEGEICYGRSSGIAPAAESKGALPVAIPTESASGTLLPFDEGEIVENLRNERYMGNSIFTSRSARVLAAGYYVVRPFMPVAVRKHIQRVRMMDWDQISFPHWPVDVTVDNLSEHLMLLALESQGLQRIPFIWFWPNGASSCAIMTHDVETTDGRDFCSELMNINDRFGIKSSFQVVPEKRYEVPESYLQEIRDRDFEVNVQDLNHDGRLYRGHRRFLRRVAKINQYGKAWKAKGFRAGILYRRQEWFKHLDFSYEMSVPNVAPLDPQRGGCCTVMPYFIGNMLELPVTTIQDYSLFNLLNDYTINLWKRQCELIMSKNGMMSFIVHPDYIISKRANAVYEQLLDHIAELREQKGVWVARPGEVDVWWRQRHKMRIVPEGNSWRIEGEGSERARLAYARVQDGQLRLSLEDHPVLTPAGRHQLS